MTSMRLAVLVFLIVLSPIMAQADSVRVIYSDGRPSESIPVLERDGDYFASLTDIGRLLDLSKTVDPVEGKATLECDNHYVEVIVGGTIWLVDGEPVKADGGVMMEKGEFYVSLGAVEQTIAPAFQRAFRWNQAGMQVVVGLPSPNVVALDVETAHRRTAATLRTVGVLKYDLFPLSDRRIELIVRGGVAGKDLNYDSRAGLIESIRARHEARGLKLVITLADEGLSYRVFPRWEPDGIVISVWRRALSELPEPELRPPRQLAWPERFSPERTEIDVIVIDPGHGGENLGSIGPTGYTEKEANLAIATKLKEKLERAGMEVFLTRSDDVFLPLERRTEIANSVEADLFISLHANGYRGREARGFEVYFLSPAVDEEDKMVAAMENAAGGPGTFMVSDSDDEVAFILWDTAQNEFIVESSDLAQFVNEEMTLRLDIPNRGVKQADFVVLTGAYLPAILVETAFITNPTEEGLLRDDAFQETVAGAVAAGVERFRDVYGR
jgi:N-acetylmuramoyl-L-alanine amidase